VRRRRRRRADHDLGHHHLCRCLHEHIELVDHLDIHHVVDHEHVVVVDLHVHVDHGPGHSGADSPARRRTVATPP
jgi:hypothetical protein